MGSITASGKTYHFIGFHDYKNEAETHAKNLRKQGFSVRIKREERRTGKKYVVYGRET